MLDQVVHAKCCYFILSSEPLVLLTVDHKGDVERDQTNQSPGMRTRCWKGVKKKSKLLDQMIYRRPLNRPTGVLFEFEAVLRIRKMRDGILQIALAR